MDEFARSKKRTERRLAKKILASEPEIPKSDVRDSTEKTINLGGQRYTVPERKKEGLTLKVVCRAFGKEETLKFFHPNPEAYVPWQDYGRLREYLRLALNTKFPGIR